MHNVSLNTGRNICAVEDPGFLERGAGTASGLRGGVGRGPTGMGSGKGLCPIPEKKSKFCSCAFLCILSINRTNMQISCLQQHATNVETVPQTVSMRHTFIHKKPRYQKIHGAIGGMPLPLPGSATASVCIRTNFIGLRLHDNL